VLLSLSWIVFSIQSRGRSACGGPMCKLPELFILWSGTHPRGSVPSSLWLNQARSCLFSLSLSSFRQSRFSAASRSRARARGELARLVLHPEVSSAEEDHQDPDQFTGVPQSVRLRPRLAFGALNHVHPRQRAREKSDRRCRPYRPSSVSLWRQRRAVALGMCESPPGLSLQVCESFFIVRPAAVYDSLA